MKYKILINESDWYWYKAEIDLDNKYCYKHIGNPEKYPCGVRNGYSVNPYGDDEYHHEFYYQQEITCDKCGHKTLVWPETEK